ncbi:hypothetical protein Tco_0033715 [Tanacetum coccineum]
MDIAHPEDYSVVREAGRKIGNFNHQQNLPDLGRGSVGSRPGSYGAKSDIKYSEPLSDLMDFVSCDNSDKSSDSETYASCDSSLKTKTKDFPPTVDIKTLPESDVEDPNSTAGSPSFSCLENVKSPRIFCNKSGMNNRNVCKNNSVRVKKCFVCGSKLHLIKDCDFYNCVDYVPCKSKAASVPAGSRNSPASVTAGGSDPAASRNRPAVNSADRPNPAGWSKKPATVPACSRNSSASVTAGGSDPAASRNRPAVNSADRPNPAGQIRRISQNTLVSIRNFFLSSLKRSHNLTNLAPAPSDVCMDQLSSGIFTSSSYDDDFSATLTNLAPVVDAISSIKKVNTIHPSVTDTCNYSLLQFLTRSRSSKIQLEPTSIAKALEDPDWVAAMQEEMQQFLNQQVWKLVPLPNGKHAIGTKWILKNKRDARGIVVRNKARIDAIILELLLHLIWDILVLSVKALYGLPSSTLEPVQVPDIKYFTDFILMLKCGQEIFKYLKGQPKLGLWYPKDSPFQLEAYSDSDYALVLMVIGNPLPVDVHILWQKLIFMAVQKQTIEANFFNTEAKYDAALAVVHKESGIRNQLLDYGFNFMNTKIFIDNQSTICIVKNPVFHQRTKHIEIRHHFIRDANEKNLIQVDRLDSAGRTLFLLIVIISAGCFLSAGSYGLCCWFRVHADGHTSAGGFSCFADGVVCSTV